MISVIVCYNNKEIYEEMLLDSISNQNCDYNLIAINNTDNRFDNIASAYNSVLNEIKGDKVLFCHQDISFPEKDTLKELAKDIDNNRKSIVGLCGINTTRTVYSNLKYKKTNQYITNYQLTNYMEVETVDECCFGMNKELLDKLGKFDEKVCDSWHLYATEMCLRAKSKGISTIISPTTCIHKYDSNEGLVTDASFLKTFKNLRNKYKHNTNIIYSVCYVCSTRFPMFQLRMAKTKIKNRAIK